MESLTKESLITFIKKTLPDPLVYHEKHGASYSLGIRELEYRSRPLWAIFSLMINDQEKYQDIIMPYIEQMKLGFNQESEHKFLKPTTKTRQIAVEMAVYGYGLLCCKEKLLTYFNEEQKQYLEEWLYSINEIELPKNNWLFFSLMVNYGLKMNCMNYSQTRIDEALEGIEEMYIGGGWYRDGDTSQLDYYISFAFHFYSHILKRYCPDFNLDVKNRSIAFERDFRYWFDKEGRSLPFGRSLTYRYGHISYWSACIVSGIHELEIEKIKGLIFDHLNLWFQREDLCEVGYGYPNLVLSEEYNACGSQMWAMKTFVLLSLPDDHMFWKVKACSKRDYDFIHCNDKAGLLFVSDKDHHYALSASQYSKGGILQQMSKYGKFCYSSAFGWNVSRDVIGIDNFAVDQALALSVKGTNQYASRTKIEDYRITSEYIYSVWNYGEIAKIETWLIPVNGQCHVRIHQIQSTYLLQTYEGSYPVDSWNYKFDKARNIDNGIEIYKNDMHSAIVDLMQNRNPHIVKQNPNTNIYSYEINAIPTLEGTLKNGVIGSVIYGSPSHEIEYQDIVYQENSVLINNQIIKLKEMKELEDGI